MSKGLEKERRRIETLVWDGEVVGAQETEDAYVFKVKVKKPKKELPKP